MAISQKCPLSLKEGGSRNFLTGDESLACPRQLWRLWRLAKLLLPNLIFAGILFGFLPVFESKSQKTDPVSVSENLDKLATIEENSLLPIANSFNSESEKVQRIRTVVTGYSSTLDQTDSDPFITAAGTMVRDGIVATNILSFGTKIKLPELYGDKIFVVEDRMYWNKKYHIDIWFPSREEALQFGVKITDALIISN